MQFRTFGFSLGFLLLAGFQNSGISFFVNAEEDKSSCDCSQSCSQVIDQCHTKLEKANAENEKASEQLKVWQNKQGTYASLFARKEKDISDLKRSLEESKETVSTCNSDLTQSKNLSQSLQKSLDDLKRVHSDFQSNAELEKNDYSEKNQQLQTAIEALEKEIEKLGSANSQLESSLEALQTEKSALTETNKDVSTNLRDAEQQIHDLSETNIDLVETNKQLEEKLSTLEQEKIKFTAQNTELTSSLEIAQNGIGKLTEGKTELEITIQQQLDEIATRSQQVQTLMATNGDLDRKLKVSEEFVTVLTKKNEEVSKELVDKSKELENLTATLDGTKASLANSEISYNEAMQSLDSMEKRFIRQEALYTAEEKKLLDRVAEQESEILSLDNQLKNIRSEKMGARKQISDLEKELQKMHRQATSTYLNSTLVVEDISNYIDQLIDRVNDVGEKATKRTLERSSSTRQQLNSVIDKVSKVSAPHVMKAREMYTKHAHSHVQSSRNIAGNMYNEHASPIISQYVQPLWEEYGVPLKERALEAFESTRLTMVSSIEVGSKTIVSYFEVSKDSRSNMNPLVKRIVNNADRVNKNAETIVNYLLGGIGFLLSFYIFGSFVIGTIFTFVFMPYYIVKYFFFTSAGKKKKTAPKMAPTTRNTRSTSIAVGNISAKTKFKSDRPAQ